MFIVALKGLAARKLRLLLTAVSIALGVSFVTGTFVLGDTMTATFDKLYADMGQGTDVTVRARPAFTDAPTMGSPRPMPVDLVDRVREVPGVAAAEGGITGYALMLDKSGKPIQPGGAPTLGVSHAEDEKLGGSISLRAGRAPAGPNEVAIDAATARKHGYAPGDRIRIVFESGKPADFALVGVIGFGDADNLAGATLAAFDLTTAQQVLGRPGQVDQIAVRATDGIGPDELRTRIAAVLPADLEAVTRATVAGEASRAVREGLSFFTTAFLGFAAVSLLVGGFLIWNTFSILVAQRGREHALLRAIGARRRQLLAAVLTEAVAVGLLASALGLGLGLLVSGGLRGLLAAVGIEVPTTTLQLESRTVVAALAVGLGVTLVAALVPAWRATRVPPIAALREAATPAHTLPKVRIVLGGALLAAGLPALSWAIAGPSRGGAAMLGSLATFVGFLLLAPALVRPLVAVLGAPIARLGMAGELARQNAGRTPRRTASTAAALTIGLTLVVAMTVVATSMKASVADVLVRANRADLILKADSQMAPGIPAAAADKLRVLPEVGVVSPMRFGRIQVAGQTNSVAAVDPGTAEQVADIGVASGSLSALADGEFMATVDEAKAHGWQAGDQVTLRFPHTGDHTLRLAGTYTDTTLLGAGYLITIPTYEENFSERLDVAVLVTAAGGIPADALKRSVQQALADYPNVAVQDTAEFNAAQGATVDQLLGLVNALLGLAVLIALLGVVNTLALSVLERTRELGLLRAVGMTRRQVRACIRWEAVLVAAIGSVLGTVLGLLIGMAAARALAGEGITVLQVPIAQPLVYAVVGAAAGILAAITPARKAAKVDVLRAVVAE
ncbi:ABC transporter permease [Sphaerimonospora thailandensis]|uniref:ABC transporter substrate-binding protein n=1 Tax=Sphaerimonospora thailandensis TaxID=795644 RepID=A0A8J3RBA2_9ACTN|nr:ABC transporter permease [Sphaerimonospora thailandensis]GIH71519.1 ABC transporter substrate-binding protein [Sphaerimonospora thailandensis]